MDNLLWTLLGAVIGYPLGLFSNFVIGKVFEYRAFLHQAIYEVRLLSGKLMYRSQSEKSADYDRIPRADASVRLCADQCGHMKQKRIAEKLREVESAISAKFEQAQRQQGTVIDINAEKDRWISTMENLKPDWFLFIRA